MITEANVMKVLCAFVPELKPLQPQIVALVATFEKGDQIMSPTFARLDADQPAFIEAAEASPELLDLLPDIRAAVKTFKQVQAILLQYEAKIES